MNFVREECLWTLFVNHIEHLFANNIEPNVNEQRTEHEYHIENFNEHELNTNKLVVREQKQTACSVRLQPYLQLQFTNTIIFGLFMGKNSN